MSQIQLSEAIYARMRRFGAPTDSDEEIVQRLCDLTEEHLEFLLRHEQCILSERLLNEAKTS